MKILGHEYLCEIPLEKAKERPLILYPSVDYITGDKVYTLAREIRRKFEFKTIWYAVPGEFDVTDPQLVTRLYIWDGLSEYPETEAV